MSYKEIGEVLGKRKTGPESPSQRKTETKGKDGKDEGQLRCEIVEDLPLYTDN